MTAQLVALITNLNSEIITLRRRVDEATQPAGAPAVPPTNNSIEPIDAALR